MNVAEEAFLIGCADRIAVALERLAAAEEHRNAVIEADMAERREAYGRWEAKQFEAIDTIVGPAAEELYVIVEGRAGPDGRFVEVETLDGRSVKVPWTEYPNDAGLWRLGPFRRP